MRKKYAPKFTVLQDRIRRAEQAREREAEQAKAQHLQTAISFGATLLGAFLGRKTISSSTLEKAASAARGVGRSIKESKDVGRAEETVEVLRSRLADLEAQFDAETNALDTEFNADTEILETLTIRPVKTDIVVKLVALAWTPYWEDQQGQVTPAWM